MDGPCFINPMTHETLAQDIIDQIQVYDHEYGTGRVTFGAYLYLMSHVELTATTVIAMADVVSTIRDNGAEVNTLLTSIQGNGTASNGLLFTALTLLTTIRDNAALSSATIPAVDFQFGKGTAAANALSKLVGVVTAKAARRGVVIRNLDEKESLLVTTTDKATAGNAPTPAQCFWLGGLDSIDLPINTPDSVLISGNGKAIAYSWTAR